jgi:hypothetical protein
MFTTIVFYIFGLLLVVTGIFWLKDITNILSSIIFIVSGLLVIPAFNGYFIKKYKITDKVWEAIKVAICIVGLFGGIILGIVKSNVVEKRNIAKAEKLIEQARGLINNNQIDSAIVLTRKASGLYPVMSETNGAKELLKEYSFSKSIDYVNNTLLGMKDKDYELLLRKQLTKKYFSVDKFNEIFLSNLYENRLNRPQLIKKQEQLVKEQKVRARKLAADAMQLSANMRKEYEETLHNAFLDAGLNIKVSVYGTSNTKMKLTYSLFNDVWGRKFQTEGYFNKWKALGFNRVYLTDGYEYSVYYDL